jgi:hypothetical protein
MKEKLERYPKVWGHVSERGLLWLLCRDVPQPCDCDRPHRLLYSSQHWPRDTCFPTVAKHERLMQLRLSVNTPNIL